MPKYLYSVVRFVPSPVRGEFVNVGLIIGSDRTGEWHMDVVRSMARASRLDDDKVLSLLATDLSQLESTIENYTKPEMFDRPLELSEDWLRELSRNSRNQLQFSNPNPVVAESIDEAFGKLWKRLIVESPPVKRNSISKATVTKQYVAALSSHMLERSHLKQRVKLETSKTHMSIDVVVHNGVVKDITQCWSLQVKAVESVLNDIRAWGWSIKTLREHGGVILAKKESIEVPSDVRVGVVYAATKDNKLMDEVFDVFRDPAINADCVSVENATQRAQDATKWVTHQPSLDLDV